MTSPQRPEASVKSATSALGAAALANTVYRRAARWLRRCGASTGIEGVGLVVRWGSLRDTWGKDARKSILVVLDAFVNP